MPVNVLLKHAKAQLSIAMERQGDEDALPS